MQKTGLDILYFLDGQAAVAAKEDQIKAALLARGMAPEVIYPEYFSSQQADGSAETDSDDTLFDYSAVKWSTPSQGQNEFERLQEQMAANQYLTLPEDDGPLAVDVQGFLMGLDPVEAASSDSEWV